MTGENSAGRAVRTGRLELAAWLGSGAAGVGLVLLATRQQVAKVIVTAPHPLPGTITPVNAQALAPAAAALAIAALASLGAVLATRGLLRRIIGIITTALGTSVALVWPATLRAADVLTAVGPASVSPASGGGGGIAPGSTTAGTSGGVAGSLAGFPAHVEFAGTAWRVLLLVGAALIAVAGAGVFARAARLPAMSSRYERAAKPATPRPEGASPRVSTAGLWDSLSAGADPTATFGGDEPG